MSSLPASELVGRRATVEVPATIANLGAGFDCLALAVDLVLRASIEVIEGGIELTVEGEGFGELAADRSNRLVEALERGLGELGIDGAAVVGWRIDLSNPIPLSRGLGSSAAATVAGLVLAGAIADRPLETEAVLRLATRIEGHPDNVAAALLGGLVASVDAADGLVEAVRIGPPDGVSIVAWIPERRLATAEMRRVLPSAVPRTDAVANLARVAVGVAGLASGRADVLRLLTEDRLHEPYRAAAYPELSALIAAARGAGALGACLAGAGSTIVAFVDDSSAQTADTVGAAMRSEASRLDLPGRLVELHPSLAGATVTSASSSR